MSGKSAGAAHCLWANEFEIGVIARALSVRLVCGRTESLQDLLLVSGKSAGAGHCLWANEFEIGVIAKALRLGCLILGQSHSAFDFLS